MIAGYVLAMRGRSFMAFLPLKRLMLQTQFIASARKDQGGMPCDA
jgi:hypothetical protein